ncbi:hypothetical protein ACEPAG_195 [Sanghuangporus baumii]
MDEFLYPNYRQEVIDAIGPSEGPSHWITSFQFRDKGKRKDDLVALGLGKGRRLSDISLYENPQNLDFDEGIEDDSVLTRWNKLALHKLKQPSSCISVDVTRNGFSDLVVTCEYGETFDIMDPYGGRICWLENFGTNEGDWSCHEIGRFPGVNCIKDGHFTTTYSLQLLAVVKSSRADAFSPLIIFTRPPDIYKSKHWLVATALESVFSSIQDCIVIPGTGGALNNVLISSKQGLSLAWYHGRSWQYKPLNCVNFPSASMPGRLCTGRVGRDAVAFIVSSEAFGGSKLSIYIRNTSIGSRCEFRDVEWRHTLIDDFSAEYEASILDILCEDLDGDGVDEIIVSLSSRGLLKPNFSFLTDLTPLNLGPDAGIYYFDMQEDGFIKYKLHDEAAVKLTCGHFTLRNRLDLALVTRSKPSKTLVLYQSYVSSQIKPSIEGSELLFYVPRSASSIGEVDVIDIAGYTISLIILPSNASFDIASDGTEAVKVLHGLLGWVDSQSEIIERARVACAPGCVAPMLVDSPEGHVRSGNDGAVFVRMRTSSLTDAVTLNALNVLPSYFPCDVRAHEFSWHVLERDGRDENTNDLSSSNDLYHLPAFRVRFHSHDPAGMEAEEVDSDIAFIHFWAAKPGSQTPLHKSVSPPSSLGDMRNLARTYPRQDNTCSIRASLSNPNGEGGLIYCNDPLGWGFTPPTPLQISRARKLILPVMYEHGPFWRTSKAIGSGEESTVEVEYPWHSWVSRGSSRKHNSQMKWDIWAAFDFSAFEVAQSQESDGCTCIIC